LEALARRQVLIEKGVLAADYPIPAQVREPIAANLLAASRREEKVPPLC
jgi:hypothetical protein